MDGQDLRRSSPIVTFSRATFGQRAREHAREQSDRRAHQQVARTVVTR